MDVLRDCGKILLVWFVGVMTLSGQSFDLCFLVFKRVLGCTYCIFGRTHLMSKSAAS